VTFASAAPSDKADAGGGLTLSPIIYVITLNLLSPCHPWFGKKYVGQSARAGFDAQGTLRERTREHLAAADEAALDPESATGLRWALLKFGASSFSVEIADSRQSISRPEAYEWMNRREKELIAKYGGPLQTYDLDRRVRQTLNLTEGGQGGSERFASAVSLSARHWRTAKENIETYTFKLPRHLAGAAGLSRRSSKQPRFLSATAPTSKSASSFRTSGTSKPS